MKVSLIAAMDKDRGIGKNNDLMWHLPADMKFFKDTTKDQVVVMGRKNFDSIPDKYRPLPKRENVILTRNTSFQADNCKVMHSIEACMEAYKNEEERTIFIIGGGEIYKLALDAGVVDEMYITHINHSYGADTFFPEFDLHDWTVETIYSHEQDEKHGASFSILKYSRR